MKTAVIINSSAGSGYSGDEAARIKMAFTASSAEVKLFEISGEKISDIINKAVESGYNTIAAAGGDGTISAAVNAVINKGVPFGVIPLGTLNHFAKDIGIPLVIEEAVQVIIERKILNTDVAEVNGHYFINNSSVGLYPKIVKHRDKEMQKLGYGKWYAMLRAVLNIFKKFPVLKLKVLAEDHYNSVQTPFIFIGNNQYSFDLFNLGIRENITEGMLSLYYPKTSGRFSIFRFAFLALINRLKQEKDFIYSTSREVQIISKRDQLEVSADGEVLHIQTPLNYKIHPGKLQLIVPGDL